jgi:hypothetical protein
MSDILRRVLVALPLTVALQAPPAFAEVIDDIAIERRESGTQVRLRLTGPVHYIRDYVSPDGETANVYLEALSPEKFSSASLVDEVKQSPRNSPAPRFEVRVILDPRCDAAPNPVCIVIRFERPVRCRIRLGEDRRSLLLDLSLASDGEKRLPPAREKP